MIKIPQALLEQFEICLGKEKIPVSQYVIFKKWLRYYLDFCQKYNHPLKDPESLRFFVNKLREKKQTKANQKKAFDSILIYYKIFDIHPVWPGKGRKHVREKIASYAKKESLPGEKWRSVYDQLNNEIRVRHYSPKTFKSYRVWIGKFQVFFAE